MQILSLLLTIFGAILSLAGTLIGNLWLAVIGTLLIVIGAIGQYLIGKPYLKEFTENDWVKRENEYTLTVPAARHLRGRGVAAKVYLDNDGTYEAVMCDEVEEKNGAFIVRVTKPFRGRLVLK